jgi:hypothetical protein
VPAPVSGLAGPGGTGRPVCHSVDGRQSAAHPALRRPRDHAGRRPLHRLPDRTLVDHITGATVFALLGIGQLVPRIRSRHRAWHRLAGRVVAEWVSRRPARRGQTLDRSSAKTAPEGALP